MSCDTAWRRPSWRRWRGAAAEAQRAAKEAAETTEKKLESSVEKNSMEVAKEEGNVRRECSIPFLPCFESVIATAF